MPYSDRLHVSLDVHGSEMLGEVFQRALEELKVEIEDEWAAAGDPLDLVDAIAFYSPADEIGLDLDTRSIWLENLLVVDERGLARWGGGLSVRYDALMRASSQGLVDGDPLRPYLILQPRQGEVLLASWAALVTALSILANVEGTLALKDRLLSRIRRGQAVAERHAADWSEQGAHPAHLRDLVDRRPWATQDLAMLLGLDEGDCTAWLELRGYTRDECGRWEIGSDEEARLLRMIDEELLDFVLGGLGDEDQLQQRLTSLRETGQRPPGSIFERPDDRME